MIQPELEKQFAKAMNAKTITLPSSHVPMLSHPQEVAGLIIETARSAPTSGRPTKIVVDILRIERERLAEHWDVMQDEATRAESKSGLPMFGNRFAQEKSP